MSPQKNYSRRHFFKLSALTTAGIGLAGITKANILAAEKDEARRLPYKIGMRQASLCNPGDPKKKMIANFDTFQVARDISGIDGVELQVASGNPNMLYDFDVARRYKAEAHKWGLDIPSTAGVWGKGAWNPAAVEELTNAIRATEIVGASVMLIAFFGKSAPSLSDAAFYDRVVSILREVAPRAKDAGVVLGLENSLSPADNKTLVDRIGDPQVKVYYDPENMFNFGHPEEAVPGIKILGKERIAAVHLKNNGRLLSDNWRVDWVKALHELTDIEYEGWLTFETDHQNHESCIAETEKNIAFIKSHFQPPVA